MLTGKHKKTAGPDAGRFKGNKLYTDRFWKDSYFEAADALVKACEEVCVRCGWVRGGSRARRAVLSSPHSH